MLLELFEQMRIKVLKSHKILGYIDLSKSKLNSDEQKAAYDRFAKAKAVHSIFLHVSSAIKADIDNLYVKIIWPLYKKDPNTLPLDTLLKYIMISKEDKTAEIGIDNQQLKNALTAQIKRRYKKPSLKSISKIKLSIRTFDGIILLKQILKQGVDASKEKGYDINVVAIGAPDYLFFVETSNKEEGEEALYAALNKIQQVTKENHGIFEIKQKPRVVGDSGFKIQDLINEELENNNKMLVANSDDSDMGEAQDDM